MRLQIVHWNSKYIDNDMDSNIDSEIYINLLFIIQRLRKNVRQFLETIVFVLLESEAVYTKLYNRCYLTPKIQVAIYISP